jgi:DNA-binding response OmpR family regulator
MKVLIVDSDTDHLDTLGYVLRREGYDTIAAADGSQALKRWRMDTPDLVLLDAALPSIDGFEVCRQIRQAGATPIIMSGALPSEQDRVRGLLLGADDYLTKPFGMRELCARMTAVLRRSRPTGEPEPTTEIHLGDLVLNLQSCQVHSRHAAVRLTRIEFRILSLLALNIGRVVPHGHLIEHAWGYQDEGSSHLLKTHVSHLRRKLHEHCDGNISIESMVNVGYRLVADDESTTDSQPGLNPLATSFQPTEFMALSSMG